MKLKIVQMGDPVLRQTARPLTMKEVVSEEIQRLIVDMRETMHDAPGVGLAAPQVGLPIQLAVVEDREELLKDAPPDLLAERERKPVPFHVLINPRILLAPDPTVVFFEGCLSLPGFTALVPRTRTVRLECLDERGAKRIIDASGWYARILQHEVDHLAGCLYVDRMRSRTFGTLDNFNRHWKNKTVDEVRNALEFLPS
ncbi:MAG TPA: peptide deformylase [Candidatus Aquilonibacter sp.]|nr:peptide deformylase [Candidatus Aquilonibacter sp.]